MSIPSIVNLIYPYTASLLLNLFCAVNKMVFLLTRLKTIILNKLNYWQPYCQNVSGCRQIKHFLEMKEFEFKRVDVTPSDRRDGKFNLTIKMLSLYENGRFVKHLPLTPELAAKIKGKRIRFDDWLSPWLLFSIYTPVSVSNIIII